MGKMERNTATAPIEAWDLLRRDARLRGVPLATVTAEAIEAYAQQIMRDRLPKPVLHEYHATTPTAPDETSEPIAGPYR
ncbi:MAG: hypothetical protein ACKVZ6_08945 [Kineosporiaceae bacterium]